MTTRNGGDWNNDIGWCDSPKLEQATTGSQINLGSLLKWLGISQVLRLAITWSNVETLSS